MKLVTIFLLAIATAFAGHDDWRRPPHNTPSTPAPEPAAIILVGLGLAGLIAFRSKRK